MIKSRPFSFLTVLLLIITFRVSAGTVENPPVPTMDPSDIRPGMTGYGLTVFHGVEPERFDVVVEGVLRNYSAKSDFIVISASHPMMKDIGAIAGMSGSPIYIHDESDGKDKLIGALAYGWPFSVRPICGVTPIKDMFEVYDQITEDSPIPPQERSVSLKAWPEAQQALGAAGLPAAEPVVIPQSDLAAMGIPGMDDPSGTITMEPLSTPLIVTTDNPQALEPLKKMFAGTVMQPVMSGAITGRDADTAYPDAKPVTGGAFSVVFVDGDAEIFGMGTMTYVDDNRMIAFGHQLFGQGPADGLLALNEVFTVVPSLQRPFKLGNMIRPIGALRQDRPSAVGGVFDRQPSMIPVTFRIRGAEFDADKTYHFRIWNKRDMFTGFLASCYFIGMETAVRVLGPMTETLRTRIVLEDGRELTQDRHYAGVDLAPGLALADISNQLDTLLNNRFEPVELKEVHLDMIIETRPQLMMLDRVVQGNPKRKAGETFSAEVEYARWREAPRRFPIKVPLPANLKPGSYQVMVMDGFNRAQWEMRFHPELTEINSFDDLIRYEKPDFPSNQVYLLLIDPADNLVLHGQKLTNLPRSIAETTAATMREPAQLKAVPGRLLYEKRLPFAGLVLGNTSMDIQVVEDK